MRPLAFVALLLVLGMTVGAADRPVAVLVTRYGTPRESDFGAEATEPVPWRDPDTGVRHVSRFVPGFASREVDDPKRPGLLGAGMEGAGWIEPSLHPGDAPLAEALARGYRVLSLESWDPDTGSVLFSLAKAPLAADGSPLRPNESAAVKAGDRLFPMGAWIEVRCAGRSLGRWRVHDECSSCEDDAHVDLYVGDGEAEAPAGPCEARRL